MTKFNFLNTSKTVEFKKENYIENNEIKNINVAKEIKGLLTDTKKTQQNPLIKIQEVLIKKKEVDLLESIITNILNYLDNKNYLPSSLPDTNIDFLKAQKIPLLATKEQKEVGKYQDLAMVQLSTTTPTIYLSLDLLLPRNEKKSGFIEVAKSAVKDESYLIPEEKTGLIVEIAFLHELGHIFSILNHTNKNYFLQTTDQPILDSLKRNYEESFAEAFCLYILKEKYPQQKFIKWLQAQRKDNERSYKSGPIIYEYCISGVYDFVEKDIKPSIDIDKIVKDIEKMVYGHLIVIIEEQIKATEKLPPQEQFLELLNKEIKSNAQLKNAEEVISKIKSDFAVFAQPPVNSIKNKLFKLRDNQSSNFRKSYLKLN